MSGFILPGDDVVSIAERVRRGDASVGWRGDPRMDVYLDEQRGVVQVWGWDSLGYQYIAAEVNPFHSQGWRHELLRRLKDGDWQNDDLVDKQIAWVEAPQIERAKAFEELKQEKSEHIAWALRKDLGHHFGGLTREFY